ncbi:MAG: hypothetical protein EBU96_05590 [Actinobacteria bacterium]|nr:hypothetical protein [Actinomycetota bacterium]
MRHRLRAFASLVSIAIMLAQIPAVFGFTRFHNLDLVKLNDFSLTNYAKVTNAGQFPVVVFNREGIAASLSNVTGLISGRRDNSKMLFSHSHVLNNAPPIEILKSPTINPNEHAYTATYQCRIEKFCILTIFVTNSDNEDSNVVQPQSLWGYHLSGTNEYFIMNPNSRRLSE